VAQIRFAGGAMMRLRRAAGSDQSVTLAGTLAYAPPGRPATEDAFQCSGHAPALIGLFHDMTGSGHRQHGKHLLEDALFDA